MPIFVQFNLLLSICFAVIVPTFSQNAPPDPKDYPVAASDKYTGKPVDPIITTRRARTYRTVIREGAKEGPNFAGRYTIVTWGAGLATFSMAVVDAKTGIVYFPPFKSVYGSGFGLPFVDDGSSPAWRIDSRLFSFIGRPDVDDKGIGLYVYSFDRGRFELRYFEKEDEEKRKAERVNWEKELDRRMDSMSKTFLDIRKRLSEIQPNVRCYGGPSHKYPIPAFDITCTEDDLILGVTVEYHTTPDGPEAMLESEVEHQAIVNLRNAASLGDKGFGADHCSRAWLRFQKGTFYVRLNANMNREGPDSGNCVDQQNEESRRLAEFSSRIAFILADWLE
jgi:hypothetical protein